MQFFTQFSGGDLKLGRMEAFSDGVFAIVVTLLVLDMKVPHLANASSAAELFAALREQLPRFFSWLISFIIVCKFWLNHHQLLAQTRSANYAFVWLNSLFLMGQSFIPFPTGLMGEYSDNPLAVSFFGIVMAINTFLFIVLQAYALKHLLKPEFQQAQVPNLIAKSFFGVAFYLVGAASACVHIHIAFAFYLFTPLLFIVPPSRKGA